MHVTKPILKILTNTVTNTQNDCPYVYISDNWINSVLLENNNISGLSNMQRSHWHIRWIRAEKEHAMREANCPGHARYGSPIARGYKTHLTSLSYMLKPRYFICLITLPHHNHFHTDLLRPGSQCGGGAAFSSCLCPLRAFCSPASHGLCLI